MAVDQRAEYGDALVGIRHFQLGRFTDKYNRGAWQAVAHQGDGIDHAKAGRLLVITEHQMDRAFERSGQHLVDLRERDGGKGLHVDRTAPIGLIRRYPQGEGITAPMLPCHGHDIGMTGQHNATVRCGADGGKQRGLVAVGIGHADHRHTLGGQNGLDIVLQSQIGLVADGVETDKLFKNGQHVLSCGGQCSTRFVVWLSREKAGIATLIISPFGFTIV